MGQCKDCKWWGKPYVKSYEDCVRRQCTNSSVYDQVEAMEAPVIDFHAMFGCIHFESKADELRKRFGESKV